MTPRERTMAVFRGEKVDKIVWQPRLAHWYEVNKKAGTLPDMYRGMELLDIYDDLGASPRAYHFFNATIQCIQGGGVEVRVREDEDMIATTYITPMGKLGEVQRKTEYGTTSYHTEYLLKRVEDFKVLAYILKGQSFEFDQRLYSELVEKIGGRAEPVVTVPWLPLQRLFISYMGFERAVLTLWKDLEEVEALLHVMEESDDLRFHVVRRSPIRIVNFGDNIHHDLVSPPLFKRYALPYYQRRTRELHDAGKFCTAHWDGRVKRLLTFMRETGLDGIECLTPEPMGDVTLEDLREALDGMVLVDGIPATHFLPLVSYQELKAFTYRVLDMFRPRIVLGISDMLPPGGDIEKVRYVGELVDTYTPA